MLAEISLPADMRSPRAARHFVALALESWGLHHFVDVVTLLTSELATNTIIHGGTEVDVWAHCHDGALRIEVGDRSKALLAQRDLDTDQVGGRGLFLVEAMSRACGVELHTQGKRVWFELDLHDPAAIDAAAVRHLGGHASRAARRLRRRRPSPPQRA